ncbi:MAG TPA: acyl-CoA dehydrogenase family protein [Blastocatellia bacterium]|jgi:citronellyl-CoA dehydrogenase|nr:acyl-CoA dehydrogenase family protein [Blastocatellia bacterium]
MSEPAQLNFPYFTEEHEMLRDTVKKFVQAEIAPHAEEWDEAGIFPKELFKKAADLGLFGIRIDPKWGGSGLDWWATAAYLEGFSYCNNGGVGMAIFVQSEITLPVLEELGNDEQREEFLKPAVAGDRIAALAISEPGGGSDVAALKTRARIEGDELVITGQKLWITNGTRADFMVVAVRTGGEGHRGISMVLFPTDVKGFSVGKKLKKVGNLASDTAELFFDNCRIPSRYILGEMGKGFYYTMHNFQGERLAAAISNVAMMERAIEYAVAYGRERRAFGRPIGQFQVWKHRFAEHLTSVEAAKWLTYRALDLINRGERAVREITMAKLFTSDLSQKVTYDCMQIFGGFGYTTDYPISRFWRDARLSTIGAGASEIMKEILVKEEKLDVVD